MSRPHLARADAPRSLVGRVVDALPSWQAILGASAVIAGLSFTAAATFGSLAPKSYVDAAIASHATKAPDQVATAPAVTTLQAQLVALAQRVAVVEATGDDNARDLDWIKGALFQLAQRQHVGVDAPPTRRRPSK